MTFIEVAELFRFIGSILIYLLAFTLFIIALVGASKKGITRQRVALAILALGAVFTMYLAYNVREIAPADWVQIMLTLGLVALTGFYALSASRQADANVKTAEELRQQRIMASRPFIIQRAELKKAVAKTIITDYFSHFEIHNAGNGPAIEVETSILNEKKSLIYSNRQSYLRTGESVKLLPVEFGKIQRQPDIEPSARLVPIHMVVREKLTYLVSEYPNILSSRQNPTWYQTWLPFEARKASKAGEVYVKPGELEFREVTKKGRVNAFGGRSKPK